MVGALRSAATGMLERWLEAESVGRPAKDSLLHDSRCPALTWERTMMARAIVASVDRVLDDRSLSPHVLRTATRLWARALTEARPGSRQTEFEAAHGVKPPWFLVISPGHGCNLHCPGCYADSGKRADSLSWTVLDRVITEARALWGTPLVVFTGGEPLAYRSEDRGVVDMVEKHRDLLFLVFTNGTLVDEQVAERLGRAGNTTLAFSLEGSRQETDSRRGAGTFDRVRKGMALVREAGFPLGVSLTATSSNCAELLSDEFLDFCFATQGAVYGFLFMYMPMGRGADIGLMPSARQRLDLWRRTWEVIVNKKLFLFDFWNHALMVHGCLAAGRQGGYLHIDWNGKVMPCVFAPYAGADILDIYRAGGDLNDVWRAPFFESIRGWQREYAGGDRSHHADWLRPCPVRDHYPDFRTLVKTHQAEPQDGSARASLDDDRYTLEMAAYADALRSLTDELGRYVYPTVQ